MTDHQIPKQYDPAEIETRWYSYWEDGDYFRVSDDSTRDPFTIMMPPPNITGMLHMGHGLQDTVQDTLIRYHRMRGFESFWVPGTDHAGIATQNVVEKQLQKEGSDRHQLGRSRFIERVWDWKREYGGIISRQKRKLGDSADWTRERFTMDEGLSRAVRTAFVRLFEKGLIYRGNYIVNWCPHDHTAISDEEVDHEEHQSHLWYFRYPVKGSDRQVVVATTRPETMLGDTAIAIHPEDARYDWLRGEKVILPLADREIVVVDDDFVDPEFGTGAVKVTPSHDPNDFEIGVRHHLDQIKVIDTDGRMNENAPEKYRGLDRFEARAQIVTDLEALGLLEKIESHTHSVGHCQRCNTIIEPYLSTQWFVKMKPLAEPALRAVDDGSITFYPQRWENVYRRWLEGIHDWCISRQLWWGHQIPVWYCEGCAEMIVSEVDPDCCPKCNGRDLRQDEDVLDTWFSSWLWPFSTLGWPEQTPALQKFYPTDVLVSGYDIIFFWIARMIMAGIEFTGEIPYRHVYITGMIKDEQGRWMSKSLGNGIDPLAMIEQYGADAVRYSMIALNTEGQDIKLSPTRFELGRNFANKIWNAFRFVFLQEWTELADSAWPLKPQPEEMMDRWLLSRLHHTIRSYDRLFARYKMNEALAAVYEFIWHDLCDWYLELAKPRLYDGDTTDRRGLLQTLVYAFNTAMCLLHPFMPFITEEIWQKLQGRLVELGQPQPQPPTIMCQPWPVLSEQLIDPDLESQFELVKQTVTAIRNIRAEQNIPPSREIRAIACQLSDGSRLLLEKAAPYITRLGRLEQLAFDTERPRLAASAVVADFELVIPLEGLIDVDKEVGRLTKEQARLEALINSQQQKLANESFVARAPETVVAAERTKLIEYQEALLKVTRNLQLFQ
ncbi:MAG: valine--tRNA ligase [Candidatus Delongbacteria bacterium]|nr:valine--tRNA ligase [Candidatus Delongbacteria bacterium]